jgi:hypothetical protein
MLGAPADPRDSMRRRVCEGLIYALNYTQFEKAVSTSQLCQSLPND